MIKKSIFFLLLPCIQLYSAEETSKIFTREVIRKIKTHKLQLDSERSVILEFKDLLKSGVAPELSFNKWIETRVPVLLNSPKTPIKNAGELFQKIKTDVLSINGLEAVPTLIKAVQTHHSDFSLTWYQSGRAALVGTKWFWTSKQIGE